MNMGGFLVVQCGKCGNLLLCKEGQRTRRCPYCGFAVNVLRSRKLAKAESIREAREAISKRKEALHGAGSLKKRGS